MLCAKVQQQEIYYCGDAITCRELLNVFLEISELF